ncbi:DUF4190 domain-containing protein [Mycobacterium kansasii]|uniref:DUF4190 domain-containing protein n=3 Tax=Mycobacterium kansasii TaxID=1768 RepID=U5WPK0_MYCKA|nr:DUF4190 domain-containing protein [Mycobacterium kansasii]EUA04222.1 putative membrane protein [Mycobacterium kansasii 824]AGZ51059.1 hypothetical protein MKAN_12900 [Mycobacterium kansasii ATCC 12478]ARG57155.1 hypothetical protein B1T43_16165 [Mycobacterium kansasii]ARG62681.1 hypothetical protein B1T45_16705 [Mycobacterium kansasii]ARG70297.1 hypothetical protein B1T47_15930 [Mycobacterium kansasii]
MTTYQRVPERESNMYAPAAFAFAVGGAVVLSVICAIAALAQVKATGEGRGEAIAGLVISAGWIVLFAALTHWHVI